MPTVEYDSERISDSITSLLDVVKFDPSAMYGATLDHLENITNKQIDLIDPTNPVVMLLEASAVTASSAVNESLSNLRLQYPSLSANADELYHHMSDIDFVDQFAVPAKARIYIMMLVNDLVQQAQPVPGTNFSRVKITRNTEVEVLGDVKFSIQYPVLIDIYTQDNIVVRYDLGEKSPIKDLEEHLIESSFKVDQEGNEWLMFPLDTDQFFINYNEYTAATSTPFDKVIPLTDQFYYARVYYKNANTGNQWQEIAITHSDMVFDPLTPTALLRVSDKELKVTIPRVYLNSGAISGNVRVDVYETKGKMYQALVDLVPKDFSINYRAIDQAKDTDQYTAVLPRVNALAFSTDIVNGGRSALSFTELRKRVIHNSVGPLPIPITEDQLEAKANNRNFDIYKSVDVVTERTYIANSWLPTVSELNNENIEATIELTREEFVTSPAQLDQYSFVINNGSKYTIPSNTLFTVDNGVVSMMSDSEIATFNGLSQEDRIAYMNQLDMYFTPFHYVLHLGNDSIRTLAYDLDTPEVSSLSVDTINEGLEPRVDIRGAVVNKTATGYRVEIIVRSDDAYKNLPDADVGAVLRLKVSNSSEYVSLVNDAPAGGVYPLDNGDRVFTFTLDTDYDIDEYDAIAIKDLPVAGFSIFVEMVNSGNFYLFTTNNALPQVPFSVNNDLSTLNISNLQVLTKENAVIKLGTPLKHLWTRSRLSFSENKYKVYDRDIPAFYERDIYKLNPKTGTTLTVDEDCDVGVEVLHYKGDPVLDTNGNIVYKYRKGDPVLDENGKPIIDYKNGIYLHLEVLLIDATFLFATSQQYIKHLSDTRALITQWITRDMVELNRNALELTTVEYAPIAKSGTIEIYTASDSTVSVPARYSPTITLFVRKALRSSVDELNLVKKAVSQIFVEYLRNTKLSMSELKSTILSNLDGVLSGIKITDFDPLEQYEVISIVKPDERFSIKKRAVPNIAGELISQYDFKFETIVID